MKGEVKARTVDKYLKPIRLQIVGLVKPDSSVVEFGCGNGDLLFHLSDIIRSGRGVDSSMSLIKYAQNRAIVESNDKLSFECGDASRFMLQEVDYSLASLFFHVIPVSKALKILERQLELSRTMIVCGFSEPQNLRQKLLLWFDQRFSGHYSSFREYSRNGYTKGLLGMAGISNYTEIDTFDPVIKIYVVRGCF